MQVNNPKLPPSQVPPANQFSIAAPPKPGPQRPGAGTSIMGGLGSMIGMGLGPLAYRVQAGDSLEKIARQKHPPQASAKDIQNWIQALVKLNQLPNPGYLQVGQDLVLPPTFCTGSAGTANATCSFLDEIDVPSVLKMQQDGAKKLQAELKQFKVSERLAYYQQSPPPKPSPEDLAWSFQLKAANMNQLLHYKPSADENKLLASIESSLSWQGMLNQPTRLTRADLKQLPASAQETLKKWMTHDGKADDFSSVDLAKASPAEVKQLIATLKAQKYPPHAQRLVQIIYQLSQSFSLNSKEAKAFDFKEGQPAMSAKFDLHHLPAQDLAAYQANLKQIQATLSDQSLIEQGGWNLNVQGREVYRYQPSSNTVSELDVAQTESAAAESRRVLQSKYDFNPQNPYDLNGLKNIKHQLKTPTDKADFIRHFMNAHYQHPGEGSSWGMLAHLSERAGMSDQVFFGDPPPLDRLPDGRCLIDCEGFTKLSQILLETLAPESKSLPIKKPGHIFNLAKIGDQFFVFNNATAQKLDLSPEEAAKFSKLQSDFDSAWDQMNPFQSKPVMSQKDFPSLYAYTEGFAPPKDSKWQTGDYLQAVNRSNVFQDNIITDGLRQILK